MAQEPVYRVEVARCSRDVRLFRWRILRNGHPLDLPSFAYASARSAEQAGRVALHWYRVLKPPRDTPGTAGARSGQEAA